MAVVEQSLDAAIISAFRQMIHRAFDEPQKLRLDLWNESVLRWLFCNELLQLHADWRQFIECGRVDLVVECPPNMAFIEFKFYRHAKRYLVGKGYRGFKGGAGVQNLGEFRKSIDDLGERPPGENLGKYIILVYADLLDLHPKKIRYATQYDTYRHDGIHVELTELDSVGPIGTSEEIIQARLYKLLARQT